MARTFRSVTACARGPRALSWGTTYASLFILCPAALSLSLFALGEHTHTHVYISIYSPLRHPPQETQKEREILFILSLDLYLHAAFLMIRDPKRKTKLYAPPPPYFTTAIMHIRESPSLAAPIARPAILICLCVYYVYYIYVL